MSITFPSNPAFRKNLRDCLGFEFYGPRHRGGIVHRWISSDKNSPDGVNTKKDGCDQFVRIETNFQYALQLTAIFDLKTMLIIGTIGSQFRVGKKSISQDATSI